MWPCLISGSLHIRRRLEWNSSVSLCDGIACCALLHSRLRDVDAPLYDRTHPCHHAAASQHQNYSRYFCIGAKYAKVSSRIFCIGESFTQYVFSCPFLRKVHKWPSAFTFTSRFGSARRQRKEINLSVVLLCIVVVFFCCHASRIILDVFEFSNMEKVINCKPFHPGHFMHALHYISHFAMILNSSLNFFVYCLVGHTFRRELCRTLGFRVKRNPISSSEASFVKIFELRSMLEHAHLANEWKKWANQWTWWCGLACEKSCDVNEYDWPAAS